MSKFNLEENLPRIIAERIPLVTRSWRKAYILADARLIHEHKSNYPFLGFFIMSDGQSFCESWMIDGCACIAGVDYNDIVGFWKEPHKLANLPVDTTLIVWTIEGYDEQPAHFSHVDENSNVHVFTHGRTSHTAIKEPKTIIYDSYRLLNQE
jgi:hypothetical protein